MDGRRRRQPRGEVAQPAGQAPLAAGNPASHVFAVEGQGPSTQHVFYRTGDGEICELFWRTSDEPPQPRNLTTLSRGALLAASDPVSHVFNGEGTQHVFYTADNGDIVELWWAGGSTGIPQFENLTERAGGGPVPGGRLSQPRVRGRANPARVLPHTLLLATVTRSSDRRALVEGQRDPTVSRTSTSEPLRTRPRGQPGPGRRRRTAIRPATYSTPRTPSTCSTPRQTPTFSDLHEIIELWFKK